MTGEGFEAMGATFNLFGYNTRSELTGAARYFGADLQDTSAPVGLQSHAFAFDNIGNRVSATHNATSAVYIANALNQYTQRTVPGAVDLLGSAGTNTTVTINGLPAYRQGEYWYRELIVTNSSGTIYTNVEIVAVYNPPGTNDPDVVSVQSGKVFLVQTPETFTYDLDGNLASDGRWTYTWDAENRLIRAETSTNLVGTAVPIVRVEFTYDYLWRKTGRTQFTWDTDHRSPITDHCFLYDGWNLIRELITDNGTPITNFYTWGLDLSGSSGAGVPRHSASGATAGGVGGLIAAVFDTTNGPVLAAYCFDGNGNVSDLIGDDGAILAHYEYEPFGRPVCATGPLAAVNPFQFSTKHHDRNLALLYYGYRWHNLSLGRWMSKDPLGEAGGIALYGFCGNASVNFMDAFGLCEEESWFSTILQGVLDYQAGIADFVVMQFEALRPVINQGLPDFLTAWQTKLLRTYVEWSTGPLNQAVFGQTANDSGPSYQIGQATAFTLSILAAEGGGVEGTTRLSHIFRKAPNHVNPSTMTSRTRFMRLFEQVAANPANANQAVVRSQEAVNVGVRGFSQIFKRGQVWVQTLAGRIWNAGVNQIPR